MPADRYHLFADHPEPKKLADIAAALRDGALMLYPTDTVYAFGCMPSVKAPLDRLRQLKGDTGRTPTKPFTLLCASLSEISTYAHVDDTAYKLMRSLTPGPFTFVLRATKEIPKLVLNPKRKTVGLRVPEHAIVQALIDRTDSLLVSSSARLPDGEAPESLDELIEGVEEAVDVIVTTDQPFSTEPSTMIDLTGAEHAIVREGQGLDRLVPFLFA